MTVSVSPLSVVSLYLGDGEQDGVTVCWRRQTHIQGLIQPAWPQYGRVDDIWQGTRQSYCFRKRLRKGNRRHRLNLHFRTHYILPCHCGYLVCWWQPWWRPAVWSPSRPSLWAAGWPPARWLLTGHTQTMLIHTHVIRCLRRKAVWTLIAPADMTFYGVAGVFQCITF